MDNELDLLINNGVVAYEIQPYKQYIPVTSKPLLFKLKSKKGRPRNTQIDHFIYWGVVKKVQNGLSILAACKEVAEERNLDTRNIEKIYHRTRKANNEEPDFIFPI